MTWAPEPLSTATWPAIHALLAPAIEHGGDTNAEDLIDQLMTGHAQLWAKREKGEIIAAMVSTLHTDRTMHCQLLGGAGMEEWLDELVAAVRERAEPIGVQMFSIEGRIGWKRKLEARGWKAKKIVMELVL